MKEYEFSILRGRLPLEAIIATVESFDGQVGGNPRDFVVSGVNDDTAHLIWVVLTDLGVKVAYSEYTP